MAITGGPSSAYAYYSDGSLNTLTWSPVAQPFKYTYRLNGQYDVVTFPNGQTRGYSYDDQGRVLQVASALSGTNLAAYGYGYDVDNSTGLSTMLGQRTSFSASVPAQGFTNALTKYYYDPLYQLTRTDYPNVVPFSGEIDSWTYDDIGNRLTAKANGVPVTYTYLKNGANPLNGQRLSNDGVNAYTWDNNGSNLTRNGTPGNFTFGYSVDNRLASITGAATATYTYDYQGRRTSKTVGGVTTPYLYDGLNLVTETTGGNPVNYAFGPGIDEPLATYQGGALAYMAPDALGSVSIVSSPTGTVQNSYVFDTWGTTRTSSATLTDSFGYTGREFGEAGLLGYRARYLQTGVGRFTQEDPISAMFPGGGFLPDYRYGDNNPVISTDPLGLEPSTHRVSACGSRFISLGGGVNHIPWVGDYLDKKIGNNLLGYCASCPPGQQPAGGHLLPPPPNIGNTPLMSPAGAGAAGMDGVLKQCGGCNRPGEHFYLFNIKTLSSVTSGDIDDKKTFYSLEYQCVDCPTPKR